MPTRHRLTLTWRDGREETVPASESESVLEAAESHDVPLPFGCRTGACASCVGRLVDGDADHRCPPRGLKPRHGEADYVLCCIAHPQTDCRILVGTDVRTDLVTNPWR